MFYARVTSLCLYESVGYDKYYRNVKSIYFSHPQLVLPIELGLQNGIDFYSPSVTGQVDNLRQYP